MTCLKDCNGRPYRLGGMFQSFDPGNPELELFNQYDQEVIQIGGSPIFYYEMFLGKGNTIDPLYREDRGKFWSNCPVQLYCLYEPITSQNYMNMFGMDSPDGMQFEFNYRAVLRTLGKPPKLGSRLFTPHKRENWVIVQRSVGEFMFWGEMRLILMCERFQESSSTNEGSVSQAMPDFKLNEGALLR